ncbi:HD-GYP domain-containing protein [Thermomonas sp.]|uniref:HD-GYP domain-containing protein n=1 Tax=Thermomonas sp. TaxID=1971895 RepID=UPI0035B0426E
MDGKRTSVPLYLHITLLSFGLVLATGLVLRWFGDAIPGVVEFGLLLGAVAVVAVLASRRIAAPLAALAKEAEAVRHFDFSDHPVIRSPVQEIDQLAGAFDLMRDAVRRFLRINRRLATEDDLEALQPWLLDKMVDIAGARAGVLYLVDAADDALRATAMDTSGGRANAVRDLPPLAQDALPRLLADARATMRPVSGHLAVDDLQTLGLEPAFAAYGTLALPLQDRREHLLGMLLLFKDGEIDEASASFIAALAASAATSLETQELLRGQKALMEASIRMVAGAIDAQSPYTGGHCERVPELTFMLARAACAAADGPYAGFDLDAEQWEALHIAAWLHDCGKVTTPEYVVDKATKLETVNDRIHEIRTRFEVLKRDAEIAYWRGVAEGGDERVLRARCDGLLATLDEEFAFVAQCNIGGEFLSPDKQARLREIGARRWQRTLDDRLGLSRDELARKPAQAPSLPAEETLLADKPEHRIARPEAERIPEDNRWGFRMDVPELLYNRGELHNLSISRGTLTAEERYKINEHMVQTIVMLGELPFPRHLRAVPEIAGGHHEKMDGTGYPKRLDRSKLSPLARMMAIADIFEALTAADRPYKPGKTLSEALSIMAKMRQDQHIDPELFELFLRSGVHHDYAQRFMRPEQVDAVRIEDYL